MRSSTEIDPTGSDERYVWSFDQRDIDNPNQRAYTRLIYVGRIARIVETIRRYTPRGARIADIGCAQGNVSIALAEIGYVVDGYDLNAAFLAYAQKKVERGEVTWRTASAFDNTLGGSYAAVVLGEIVEHVAHPDQLLAKAVQLVKVGGIVVVTTPNGRFIREPLPSYSRVIARGDLARIERLQFGPGGEHHLFAYSIQELSGHVPQNAQVVWVGFSGSGLLNSHVQPILNLPLIGRIYEVLANAITRLPGVRERLGLSLLMVIRRRR